MGEFTLPKWELQKRISGVTVIDFYIYVYIFLFISVFLLALIYDIDGIIRGKNNQLKHKLNHNVNIQAYQAFGHTIIFIASHTVVFRGDAIIFID